MKNETLLRLSPSQWPMVSQCPSFQSGAPGPAARRGTIIDTKLRAWIATGKEPEKDNTYEAMKWGKEELELVAEGSPIYTTKSECKFPFTYQDTILVSGEVDAFIPEKNFIADYKSGEVRNYRLQMIPYAKGYMDKYDTDVVSVDVIFLDRRKRERMTITRENADSVVTIFLERFLKVRGMTKQCKYCGWCKHSSPYGCRKKA